MDTVATRGTSHKNNFCAVAEPFLQTEGFPFAEVLDAASIQRVFRENPILLTVKRTAGRRLSTKPCYRTKSMIEEELGRKRYGPKEVRRMYRYRVLDEAEQLELIELAQERAELQMLGPLICGLHGVGGVDVREMLKGAYNPNTGILSGRRHKTGQARMALPCVFGLVGRTSSNDAGRDL